MDDLNNFNILSVNCQGLQDKQKRLDVFNYLKEKKFNIYALQDTHFLKEQERLVTSEWGHKCLFSSFSSNSRGVAFLFMNNFDYEIYNTYNDDQGNYCIVDMGVDQNNRITIVNIYGPNTDSPNFYKHIERKIHEIDNNKVIILGDFNLVLDVEKDTYNYKHINNPQARKTVLNMMENNNLSDPFREIHPDVRQYTWRKRNPIKQSRLDFFLITENMISSVKKCNILPSYRSDHSIITLSMQFSKFRRGKPLWKFNNSLLQDQIYIETVKKIILEIKNYMQYLFIIKNK